MLNKYLHTENGVHMVAAILPKIPGATARGGLPAGRYAVRFRADAVPGYKVAWLLWPDSGVWPRDGEIDFPEGNLDGTISGLHAPAERHAPAATRTPSTAPRRFTSWHTAVTEWTPGPVPLLRSTAWSSATPAAVPNTPMHWVIQTETGLGRPARPPRPANVQIDWVAVWVPQ